jgi:hypothetical protein
VTNSYGTNPGPAIITPPKRLPSLSVEEAEAYRRRHRCPHGACNGPLFVNADRDDIYGRTGTLDCASCSRTVADVRLKEKPSYPMPGRPRLGRPPKALS